MLDGQKVSKTVSVIISSTSNFLKILSPEHLEVLVNSQ